MRIQLDSWIASSIICFFLFVTSPNAFAVTCDMLQFNVDDARTELRRAANETDFEAAKDYARRAKSSLEDAAMSAMDCGCDMAHMEFDTAATHARRARNAYSPKEFIYSLNRAIRAFNSAIEALRMCAEQRK